MMIFNKKELYIGRSVKRFNEIRDVLEKADICYRAKVKDGNSLWSAGTARRTFIPGVEPLIEYVIYVHRNDYEKAVFLTGSNTRIR
jgi:hypothetical protein